MHLLSRLYLPLLTALLTAAVALSFSACENDFDSNAEYREIPVIFSLLDASERVHYVKVNKAFLNTNSNALTIAGQEPDSIYLQGNLKVTLMQLRSLQDTSLIASFPLHPVTLTNKEEGLFTYPEQVVYATDPVKLVNAGTYKIEVKNERTGKVASAKTRLVGDFCIFQVNTIPIDRYYSGDTIACSEQNHIPILGYVPTLLGFELARNGVSYKAKYIIHYFETKDGVRTEKTATYVPFADTTKVFDSAQTSQRAQFIYRKVKKGQLFETLKDHIDIRGDDPATTFREMGNIEIIVTAGGRELKRYIDVNNAFSPITQTRPYYSNVRNGTGLFSSRRTKKRISFFQPATIDTLIRQYPDLKFRQ